MTDYAHPSTLWDHFTIAMAKPYQTFLNTFPVPRGKYVQLGPGHKHISGSSVATYDWKNLDYPEWDADKETLPYLDESIDGICCYHSMDHYAKPIQVLAEIQRVLRPGAWFVNIVPHYAGELAHTDLTHKGQFGVDTWRNIFSQRHYDHAAVTEEAKEGWQLEIGFNMIMGLTERNTVLVTQMFKRPDFLLGHDDAGMEVRHIDPPLSQMKTST